MPATLRQGSRGEDVRWLQQHLAKLGFYTGSIDGIFGPQTQAAVRAYQQRYGLAVDGIVGPQTWGHMRPSGSSSASSSSSGLEQRIRSEYPGMAFFLDEPDLRSLLLQGANEGWTTERFMAQLRGTAWWRSHTNAQQDWITLPLAEQNVRIEQTVAQMADAAMALYGTDAFNRAFGSLDEFKRRTRQSAINVASGKIAFEMWQLDMYHRALSTTGTLTQVRDLQQREELARLAKRPEEIAEELWQKARADYFLRIDKDTARRWAEDILAGKASFGEFNDFMRQQAIKFYPQYAEQIENGVSPRQLFGFAVGIVANELEMSEDQVLADDRIWGQIVAEASGTGEQRPFSAADWVNYARHHPQWDNTQKAREMAGDMSLFLADAFGRRG